MKFLKHQKIVLTAAIIIAIITFSHAATSPKKPTESFIQKFENTRETTLESQKIASNGQNLGDIFETRKDFTSRIYKTDQSFTAIGFEWEIVGNEKNVHIFAQYKEIGKDWNSWTEVSENIDELGDESSTHKTALLLTKPATAFQYKILLYGNGVEKTAVKNMHMTAFTEEGKSQYVADAGGINDLGRSRVRIISRKEWGADESLRVYKVDRPVAQLVPMSTEYLEKFADELAVVRKISVNENGEELTWPLQYPDKVSKIIIHHTASTTGLDNPMQALRNIYHWHAMGRGWGDIGYNYIIDPQGNIYEGRAGGEGVVGGHAGKSNVGSIGISVMGNYENADIPQAALTNLMRLINEKAKIHGIEINGSSLFRGEVTPNVLGHRDVMSTACPGQKIYGKLKTVREFSAHELDTTEEGKGFQQQKLKGYDFENQTKLDYLSIPPQVKKALSVTIRNTGTIPWDEKTKLILKDTAKFGSVLKFESIKTTPGQIAPGASAQFAITLTSNIKPEYGVLRIAPYINGKTILQKYILLPLNIESPILNYEFVAAKWPKSAMKVGERFVGFVDLRNTGNITWGNKGDVNIRLGADHPRDRRSSFLENADTRIAFLKQTKSPEGRRVAPGEVGHFEFHIRAPKKAGDYKEYMTPVIEGISWLPDKDLHFETFVYEKLYSSQIVAAAIPDIQPGETGKAWMKIKNTGGATWKNIFFKKIGSKNIAISNIKIIENEIAPGKTGTIEFDLTAPKILGKKTVQFQLSTEGKNINQKALKFSFFVKPKEVKKEIQQFDDQKGGNKIRILLEGFDATTVGAQIRSTRAFTIYAGNNALLKKDAGESVTVIYQNAKSSEGGMYEVRSGDFSHQTQDFIRLIPESADNIFQITNYERRPAWDKTLNDNEFHGTFEIRFLESKLRIINELSIEDYLKGIAETSNTDPIEKIKAISITARSYAYYYSNIGQKFPGKPYHLDDNPDHTQKYRGYGYEKRSPNAVKAVNATQGIVITYNGNAILTPFFSQSDGRTRSAQELWGWKNTPYLQRVSDPYCKGLKLAGHGVGMSGCGALGMAQNGKTFDDILHYYYQGIVLKKMY